MENRQPALAIAALLASVYHQDIPTRFILTLSFLALSISVQQAGSLSACNELEKSRQPQSVQLSAMHGVTD